jgi:isopentenyldiphosphate isomerase
MEEQIDILDEKGEKTGEVRDKKDVHHFGLIHRHAHVYFLNPKGEILLQKRTKNKKAYPGLWDASASGHVSSGQSSVEGMQRETMEELGQYLPPSAFKYLFTDRENMILNNGTHIENAFNDIYLVYSDIPSEKFTLPLDEVEEVKWISKEEFKKWVQGKGEPVTPHYEEYKKLLEYLSNN